MFPIDAFQRTLGKATSIFRQLGIRFHLTGGVAAVYYAEPRLTQDIDIVVDNAQTQATLDDLLESLDASDFLFDAESVRRAVSNRGMFSLLDRQESLKLDIYPRELIPGELDRSVAQEVFKGTMIPVASRADTVLSKLVWASKGSIKSRRDVRQMFRQAPEEDRQIIERFSDQLGLSRLLQELLAERDEID